MKPVLKLACCLAVPVFLILPSLALAASSAPSPHPKALVLKKKDLPDRSHVQVLSRTRLTGFTAADVKHGCARGYRREFKDTATGWVVESEVIECSGSPGARWLYRAFIKSGSLYRLKNYHWTKKVPSHFGNKSLELTGTVTNSKGTFPAALLFMRATRYLAFALILDGSAIQTQVMTTQANKVVSA